MPLATSGASEGLEAWLADRVDLPEALVAASRALAAEVDRAPRDAQLWSRYLAALEQLLKASAASDVAASAFIAELQGTSAVTADAEAFRAERYRAAMAAGDEREMRRWERLVPVSCARGEHEWRHVAEAWAADCVWCGAKRPMEAAL
jgi:hypothetical protein